jgi:hypothetical protein
LRLLGRVATQRAATRDEGTPGGEFLGRLALLLRARGALGLEPGQRVSSPSQRLVESAAQIGVGAGAVDLPKCGERIDAVNGTSLLYK